MPLACFDTTADTASVVSAMRHDGAIVIRSLAGDELIDRIVAELRPSLDATGLDTRSDFNGGQTLRAVTGLLCKAPGVARLLEHDWVIRVADEILLPHCASYQIGSMAAIEILPGESAQALHRDDSLYPVQNAGMELQIGVMWALNDFTDKNGATRVVPGSHRYIRSWHIPDLSGWESAVMSKGSALFYLGSTWHGGGANRSNAPRLGLINTYSLGWLRQETNQYLDTPPEVAARFGPRLRALLGYMPHGTGDDVIGNYRGDCPAWVAKPPEPAWRENRGQTGSAAHAKRQAGD